MAVRLPLVTVGPLVLTGFMGVGKTTVARILGERLARPVVDLDARIAERRGKSVARIFAEDGEAAFRAAELELVQELAARRELVIATGGGTLLDAHARTALAEAGALIVCLDAPVDRLYERLESAEDRPLLTAAPDRLETLRQLWRERQGVYDRLPHQLSTADRSPGDVASAVESLLALVPHRAGLRSITVRGPSGPYPILIADGLHESAGDVLSRLHIPPSAACLITDDNVGARYAPAVVDSLSEAGFLVTLCTVPAGESSKRLDTVARLYDELATARIGRGGLVIGLGGGVVGDLAGFVAATYLRGVDFIQMPTTLLAMVDSSVGGKTGVNLAAGKNLVGAFKQPRAVLIDPRVLDTLPPSELAAGAAEAIKHGIIDSPHLFEILAAGVPESWAAHIVSAVLVKVRVVEADPFERGRRMVLNLGHTFGHAIERVSGFSWRHGDAVAVGLVAAAHLGHALGSCAPDLAGRIEEALKRHGLPTRLSGFAGEDLIQAMAQDKKRAHDNLRFIVPRSIGSVEIRDGVPEAEIRAAWRRVGAG